MCKKLILLISCVAVLGMVDFAFGYARWQGTNTDSNDFSDANNWSGQEALYDKSGEGTMVIDKSPWREGGDYTPYAPYLFRPADYTPGDHLRGPGYDAGTRADWFIRPGGWFHCWSAWRMAYKTGTTAYTHMTGGELIFDGEIRCPYHADANAAIVLLHGGTITAPSIQFREQGLFDFAGDGMLILDGDVRTDVEGWIFSENITAYGGAGTVVYDYNETSDGNTAIYALYGHATAWNPSPEHLAEDVCPDVNLGWTEGDDANTHTIYFGASPNDVNVNITGPCEVGYDSNSWKPPALELGTTYYWRIVEVNDGNEWVGPAWQFTVETGKARDPSPYDDLRGAPVDANLSWTASCLADSHNLYFGTNRADVNNGDGGTSEGAQSSPYDPGPLEPFTWYYWRVDEVGDTTVKGDVWSFRTRKGLLLYYKFDGSQGGNLPSPITDDSGNNIQFTRHLDGGGSLKYGAANPMYNLSGTSADFDPCAGLYRPDTGDDDILRLDTYQYTIEMWVKIETPPEGGDAMLIGKGPWRVMLNDVRWGDDPWDNELRWYHNDDGGGADNVVEENEWMHVAAVYDQTLADDGQSQRLYLNGEEVYDGGHPNPNPADNNNPVGIGLEAIADGNFARFLDGQIDELRILDVALGPLEFLWPRAIDPDPFDGEGGIDPNDPNEPDDPNVTLSWTPWGYADEHDLYFGTDYGSVSTATIGDDPNNVYVGRLDSNSYDMNGLDYATTYYWRVDEVEGTEPYLGVVWDFTTEYEMIDPNLLLWYTYDEGEGDWVFDNSGHGLHGYEGSVSGGWDPDGRFDGCLEFDNNIGFDLAERTLNGVTNGITISVWLDGYCEGGENWVVSAGITPYDSNVYYLDVIVPDGDDDFVYWRAGNDTNDLLIWKDATPEDWQGDWHHFAFVKDEDAGTMKIYFDADVARSKDGAISSLSNIVGEPFSVGARIGRSNDYVGRMDDLRVYDYALSKAEIGGLFRGGDVELAWAPSPYDGQPDAPYDSNLIWKPGDYADLHDVYFGTDWGEVNDANISTHPNVEYAQVDVNTYDLDILDLDQWYYWRVDEINDSNNDLWTGNVWRFRVADYIIIDDMEDYGPGYPISAIDPPYGWDSGLSGYGTGSILGLVTPTEYTWVLAHRSDQAMYYVYDSSGHPYYSEIVNHFALDPNNWTIAGVRMLALWFYGDFEWEIPATAVERMYVGLEDTSNTYAELAYGDQGEDVNDINVAEWQEWNIPLSSFTNVNLESMAKLYIGFGDRANPVEGGVGNVVFDNIRLYQPTCVPSKIKPEFDLNNDCIVDFGDVRVMAGDWLEHDVNFGQVTEPCDANLVGWWNFDENNGDGNVVTDSSSNGHDGVIETNDVDVWWVDGVNDVNYALDFDGGRVLVQDAPELRPLHQVSVSAWIKSTEEQDLARIVVKGADNKETFSLEADDDHKLKFQVGDGNDPNADKYPRYAASSDDLEQDAWAHVAGTFDGNSVKVYINGELKGTNNDANAVVILSQDSNDLAIGNRSDDDNREFIGIIDDVRVYDYGLTAAEVAYLATEGTGIFLLQSIADLYEDPPGQGAINFKDLAKLGAAWFDEELWPE